LEREPGYYDGPFETLQHDPEKRGKAWSIACGRISTRGYKINLHTLSIESALADDPTLPVQIDVNDSAHDRVAANVAEWRRAAEELNRNED
jgi:hypothetical protein